MGWSRLFVLDMLFHCRRFSVLALFVSALVVAFFKKERTCIDALSGALVRPTFAFMRRRSLFIAGAVAAVDARDGISEAERTVLQSFFDETFDVGKLDADRLEEALPKRIDNAMSDTSPSQRMQVLRDICVVAMADKPVCKAERKVLRRLAKGLDVPWSFVLQHLEPIAELD